MFLSTDFTMARRDRKTLTGIDRSLTLRYADNGLRGVADSNFEFHSEKVLAIIARVAGAYKRQEAEELVRRIAIHRIDRGASGRGSTRGLIVQD